MSLKIIAEVGRYFNLISICYFYCLPCLGFDVNHIGANNLQDLSHAIEYLQDLKNGILAKEYYNTEGVIMVEQNGKASEEA